MDQSQPLHTYFKRVFIQTHAGVKAPPDFEAVRASLLERGMNPDDVQLLTNDGFAKMIANKTLKGSDFVVGDFSWTKPALDLLNAGRGGMPAAPDYPPCLEHLLGRTMKTTTLGCVKQTLEEQQRGAAMKSYFIKPAVDAKAFSAFCEPEDMMIDFFMPEFGKDFKVTVSEKIKMLVEFRVYVVQGQIRGCCKYLQKDEGGAEAASHLDMKVVEESVATLANSNDEGRGLVEGCAVDFAVVKTENDMDVEIEDADPDAIPEQRFRYKTCLIEVNDGWSLGRYEGLSDRDYTDLLLARWRHVVQSSSAALSAVVKDAETKQ